MKTFTRTTRHLTVLFLACFMLSFSSVFGQSIQLNDAGTQLKITENTYSRLSLENSVSEMNAFTVKSNQGDFSQITIEGYGYSMEVGKPVLPVMKKLIEIPVDATIEISVTYESYKEYNLADFGIGYKIFPAQAPVSKSIEDPSQIPFAYDAATYTTDAFIASKLVDVIPVGTMRSVNIARLEISPVQYNPVQNVIRVYEQMSVVINFKNANVTQTIDQKQNLENTYFKGISQLLFNYKDLDNRELFDNMPVTFIIVSSPLFQDALQPFIQWKTKKGYKIVEAYTSDPNVGTTTTSIKTYLKNFYQNPPEGYNAQSFVLFVGDVAQIPSFNGTTGSHPSDLYYCEYTNDILPEVYYGRFSATNVTELQPQIDKTLEYEQYLFPDPTFLDKVVMIAGADGSHQMTWGNGQINYGTQYYFNAAHGLSSYTYLQPLPGSAAAAIRQNVSDGVGYANYTAHGGVDGWSDPSFNIGHIAALQNAHKYPLMVGNCCVTNSFQSTCFGEALLRAANKGALGYIGASNNSYWDEDYWWGVGFKAVSANPVYDASKIGSYDRTFHDQNGIAIEDWYITQGQMIPAGNLAVTQAGSSMITYYWEIYHLMGDPSLMIYFSQAPDAIASYAGLMPLGSATFTVNTNPYAFVAISKDGVLHGTALADAAGVAEIVFETPIAVPGEADVVITGQNLKPYFGTVVVASPSGPYILMDECVISDNTSGNNNGMLDYGETVNLSVSMKNLGQAAASNVVLSLTSTDEFITINNGTANLASIAPNEVVTVADAFGISAAENIPDDHSAIFTLSATDGTEVWTSNFSIKGHAPALEFLQFSVSDPNGNNNGFLDPGETVTMTLSVQNNGSADAYSVLGQLSSTDLYVSVLTTDPQEFGDLAAGALGTASYQVTAAANTPPGHVSLLTLNLVADFGISQQDVMEISFADYCEASTSTEDEYISKVVMGSINNSSGWQGGVANYTNFTTNLQPGVAEPITITNGTPWASDLVTVWVDWNQNKEFGDANESTTLTNVGGAGSSFTGSITAPANQQGGQYRMRIRMTYSTAPAPCGDATYGEIEDYVVIIPSSLTANFIANVTTVCEAGEVQFTENSTGGANAWLWQFPGGTPETSTLQNPLVVYNISGVYDVTLQVTNGVNTNSVTKTAYISVNPTPLTPTITQMGDNLVSDVATGNQWYDENGIINGATGQIYSPAQTGNYYSIVSQFGCSSAPSNVVFFQPTNIQEVDPEGTFKVYPLPANDFIIVDYVMKDTKEVTLSIYNAFGQELHNINQTQINRTGVYSSRFDVSNLPAGLYYVKIEGEDYSATRKVILSK